MYFGTIKKECRIIYTKSNSERNGKVKRIKKYVDVLLIFATTIAAFFLCYHILDNIFLPQYITEYGRVAFRFFVSYMMYVCIKWAYNKKITFQNLKVIYVLYFVFLISLSLSRLPYSLNVYNINLIIGYFEDSSKLILFANLFMYIPVGLFLRKFFPMKAIHAMLLFACYILVIEALQYVLRVGYFDINDIILNLVSFTIGLLAFPYLKVKIASLETLVTREKRP